MGELIITLIISTISFIIGFMVGVIGSYNNTSKKKLCDDELINTLRSTKSNAHWRRIIKTKL